jgi:3-oxoacyl-[acyl-carrier protein] reductase
MTLEGRVAVVTGAGRGIGRAYAQSLAESGAAVVVADIDSAMANDAATELERMGHQSLAVTVDVSDKASTLRMAEEVRERFGVAHILVNNAAIYYGIKWDPQMTVDVDYWRKVFSVNVDGALLCTQAIAPMMIEAGWGRVIMQSSTGAYNATGGHYACSKLALIGVMQGFARELGPHGITVNAIAPGVIYTEATIVSALPDRLEAATAQMAIAKKGEPEDLVGALKFLSGDEAAWITGQVLIVDGGWVKRL